MFGFSLGKLLVTALAIWVAWMGFKRLSRAGDGGNLFARAKSSARGDAEDFVKCERCGAFVAAAGAGSCEREDCPYPR